MKDAFKLIIKNHLDFFRNQDGFFVKANEVIYEDGNIIIILKPSLFRFNTEQQVSFWFDIYAFLIVDPALITRKDISSKILSAKSHPIFIKRWSFLWDKPNLQYTITKDIDTQILIDEIKINSARYFVPFCKSVKNFEDLIHFVEEHRKKTDDNNHHFAIGVGLALLGDPERSKYFFVNAAGERDLIAQIAKHYGVDINK